MRIDEFKNRLINGGARSNLFMVRGSFPGSVIGSIPNSNPNDDIRFMVRSASIPAVQVGTVKVMFQGRPLNLSGDRTFDSPWKVTVINDSTYPLRTMFEKWSNYINSIESNVGPLRLSAYAMQWYVTQYDRQGQPVHEYHFKDCWPANIGAIALDWDEKTAVEEFDVDIVYQYYEITNSFGGGRIST